MFGSIAKALFGSANDRRLKRYKPIVAKINALEPEVSALTDAQLVERTRAFQQRMKDGGALDEIIVEAFATVREGAKRALGQRHYDVQLVGGMVLNDGCIAEMKTGEGKTLVATTSVYLNALAGNGVHVITVNDYLAKRDSAWMGKVYTFLGLTVGVIVHGLTDEERKAAYACDITYGTNNEFGFDYLRDNMKYSFEEMVQRGHSYAIVDEVDSILIDEARTPLIISGPLDDRSEFYATIDGYIPKLTKEDYEIDEKQRSVSLTESGNERMEQLLLEAKVIKGSLYDVDNVTTVHHINQALKAHTLFQKDKEYIVRNDEVVIIDEFTGRMMPGRRYSEGLHQALEAKERVSVQPENQTLASITFQNYFRMYGKLAGMTGTALTEADEFFDIYKLEVVEIPTNIPVSRIDEDDEIYLTFDEKNIAIVKEIKAAQARKQPILVGTTSIEKSEILAEMLIADGFKQVNLDDKDAFKPLYNGTKTPIFAVLNARYHEQEAFIVSQAGVAGAVTIATNMAGRGTDIQLGGNADMRIAAELEAGDSEGETKIKAQIAELKKEALAAGGLYVIGTERHESRRIDNQLRGRSGRQGDPGRSKFYLSTQDDLLRIFMGDRMETMLGKLGMNNGEAIKSPIVNRALERAQGKVEARNFDMRKNVLKYDDVANDQRKVIFEQRHTLMAEQDLSETVKDMREATIDAVIAKAIPPDSYPENWDIAWLDEEVKRLFALDLPIIEWGKEEGIADEEIKERLTNAVNEKMKDKETRFGGELSRMIEKSVIMQGLDYLWREHIMHLDHLRQVVGLRGYAQKDPLNEFKSEAFQLFEHMLDNLREQTTTQLSHVELAEQPAEPALPEMHSNYEGFTASEVLPHERDAQNTETWGKVGRNEPCPCGSGKKFKHCHGATV